MKINIEDMDRILAIVIYNGKLYEDDNHQFALQAALSEDKDNIYSLDEELKDFEYVDDAIDDVAKLMRRLDIEGTIACVDVFEGDNGCYLVAHSNKSFEQHKNILTKYAEENNHLIGFFENVMDDDFILID